MKSDISNKPNKRIHKILRHNKGTMPVQHQITNIKTPFGPMAILWSMHRGRPMITQILLSGPGLSADESVRRRFPDVKHSSCPEIKAVGNMIKWFIKGRNEKFPIDILRLDLCSAFQQKVLRALLRIPRGKLTTYSELARLAGKAKASRAVGTALAKNPFPIIIPCHRVIKSDGTIGEYQGGAKMKKRLIEIEMRAM